MSNDRKGWTLIARFSNADRMRWADYTLWQYKEVAMGAINPMMNADMISPAFWLVRGRELKVTLSNDSSHTPLLQTTDDCLGGRTFRSKVLSYGYGYPPDGCKGSCPVQYSGQYKSIEGFQQAGCSGEIQSANNIGFFCYMASKNFKSGALIMIGGGGYNCSLVDHGFNIEEVLYAHDFGGSALETPSESYALHLWVC